MWNKLFIKIKSFNKIIGSMYIETIIALGILGIILTSILPFLPRLLTISRYLETQADLLNITEYIGEYIFRWVNFEPEDKHQSLAAFGEGHDLNTLGETRINHLQWATPLVEGNTAITDHYKTEITFWETEDSPIVSRNNSAVLHVLVWYDANLNNGLEPSENAFTFSTIITEKKNQ
jgi:hypothetical protein